MQYNSFLSLVSSKSQAEIIRSAARFDAQILEGRCKAVNLYVSLYGFSQSADLNSA